jgi:uncharacterized membrane protein YedE/YeeE
MTKPHSRLLQTLASAGCGLLFGLGLCLSQMTNPAKVMAFLDLAGNWDPSLLFMMLGALVVTTPAYRLILQRPAPVLAQHFALPRQTDINRRLVTGSVVFGLGWGLAGFCPGPALTVLATGSIPALQFVVSMLLGMMAHKELFERKILTAPG